MKILLIASTQQEIAPYLSRSPKHDVLITGVGSIATTYWLTRQLLHHHYDLVIQAGVAGRFSHSFLKPGDVALVTHDVAGDLGSYESKRMLSVQDLGLSNGAAWLQPGNGVTATVQLPKVKGITVNTVTDDEDIVRALQQKWQADVETMEGAAAAYVCSQKHVPFLQIRAISNDVGDRDKSRWQLQEAITNLNAALAELVGSMG